MESKANYKIVGWAVLLLTTALITGGIWLSTGFDRKNYNYYLVYMHESISGLNEESAVKYNGVRVGSVSRIELSQFDPQQVKILIRVQEGTPVTTSTCATLITQGITGTTYLNLSASSSTFIPLQKTPGEPYPVIPSKPSFFNQLEKNISELSKELKQVFSKENTENLKATLANLQKISTVIAKNDNDISKSLHELPQILSDLKIGIHKFSIMAQDLSSAGKQVSTTMKAGKNSIDKISQQALPSTVLLLRRLDLITANLEELSTQMRQNPAIILRGTTPPKPGPGE